MKASHKPKISQTTKKLHAASGAARRPSAKSRETRERVIRGALSAIQEFGLAEATTRRIAAAADVRLATLHYHFESKEALFLAVLEAMNADLLRSAADNLTANSLLELRVEELIRALWQYAKSSKKAQIAQYELTLYALRTQGASWLAARQYEYYTNIYAKCILECATPDCENAHALARSLGRFILCGMDGLILQSLSMGDDFAEQEGLQALVESSKQRARKTFFIGNFD